jgi:hypothetical protein
MTERKPPTHTAYAVKRENRADIRWLEIGVAHIESHGDHHHVFIDRLPTGGFSGHIQLSPIGEKPSLPEFRPLRPGRNSEDAEP